MQTGTVILVALLLALPGCGGAEYSPARMDGQEFVSAEGVTDGAANPPDEAGPPEGSEAGIQRRIVYTAAVDVVVEEFDDIPTRVKEMVERHEGYIATSHVSGQPGSPRSGSWTIRVPVARYEQCLLAARELGEVRSVRTESDDVTAEFYDVDARIRNQKQEEERLLQHLKESTGKLDDILRVERELSRVRGEVERMEGRLRVLKDLTSLSTINLQIDEIKDFVPEGDPGYGTRVRRAFNKSVATLLVVGQSLSIAAVAAAPWLAVLLTGLVLLAGLRWLLRRKDTPAARRAAQGDQQG